MGGRGRVIGVFDVRSTLAGTDEQARRRGGKRYATHLSDETWGAPASRCFSAGWGGRMNVVLDGMKFTATQLGTSPIGCHKCLSAPINRSPTALLFISTRHPKQNPTPLCLSIQSDS